MIKNLGFLSVKKLKIGNGMDEGVDLGPLTTAKKWIEIVKEENFVERKDIVRFLKDEYSVGHFYAQLIAKKSE